MSLTKTMLITSLLALGLAGCVQSRAHLGEDFGAIVNQNRVAQIADPDARYPQEVVTDGARVALSMERYRAGKTIVPADLSTSNVAATTSSAGAGQK